MYASAVCRNRRSTEESTRARLAQRWSADRNCFSPIRRHYHAPSCSNGSVKCQTGNSVLLCPALRSAPTIAKTPRHHPRSSAPHVALFRNRAIVRRNCGCSFYSCPCPLYIVCDRRRSSGEKRDARESTFLRGCHSIWRMCG